VNGTDGHSPNRENDPFDAVRQTVVDKSSSPPARPRPTAHPCARYSRQVFGLVGAGAGGALLLAVASRAVSAQCFVTAVVPTHRCGAVPDSHRVPSYVPRPGGIAGTSCTANPTSVKGHP
jgi:hypothetical protein